MIKVPEPAFTGSKGFKPGVHPFGMNSWAELVIRDEAKLLAALCSLEIIPSMGAISKSGYLHNVFVSYSSRDIERVRPFYDDLTAACRQECFEVMRTWCPARHGARMVSG